MKKTHKFPCLFHVGRWKLVNNFPSYLGMATGPNGAPMESHWVIVVNQVSLTVTISNQMNHTHHHGLWLEKDLSLQRIQWCETAAIVLPFFLQMNEIKKIIVFSIAFSIAGVLRIEMIVICRSCRPWTRTRCIN